MGSWSWPLDKPGSEPSFNHSCTNSNVSMSGPVREPTTQRKMTVSCFSLQVIMQIYKPTLNRPLYALTCGFSERNLHLDPCFCILSLPFFHNSHKVPTKLQLPPSSANHQQYVLTPASKMGRAPWSQVLPRWVPAMMCDHADLSQECHQGHQGCALAARRVLNHSRLLLCGEIYKPSDLVLFDRQKSRHTAYCGY